MIFIIHATIRVPEESKIYELNHTITAVNRQDAEIDAKDCVYRYLNYYGSEPTFMNNIRIDSIEEFRL